jgi:hypothetical protein
VVTGEGVRQDWGGGARVQPEAESDDVVGVVRGAGQRDSTDDRRDGTGGLACEDISVSATLSRTGTVSFSHIRKRVSWWHLKL